MLFKNYMSFTTTSDSKEFFEETALANNTNIFRNAEVSIVQPCASTYNNVPITVSHNVPDQRFCWNMELLSSATRRTYLCQ